MTHKQGDAVIIVNIGEPENATFPYRKGAHKEKENLRKVFVDCFKFKYLNQSVLNGDLSPAEFDCGARKDQQGNKCGHCIICLIESDKADKSSKYFMLAITSHGYTSDGELFILMRGDNSYLALKEVINTLKACKNLAEKTVIIIIEACRGVRNGTDAVDKGTPLVVKGVRKPRQTTSGIQETSSNTPTVVAPQTEKSTDQIAFMLDLPDNFVVINGTTANRLSYRDLESGSWFEDALQDELEKLLKAKTSETMEVNFLKLLTMAARNVSRREAGSATTKTPTQEQIAQGISRLRIQGPEVDVATNVIADYGATPGSKCCIQIVHRLKKSITFIV